MPQLISDGFDMKLIQTGSNIEETSHFLSLQPKPFVLSGFQLPPQYRLLIGPTQSHQEGGEVQTISLIYDGADSPSETIYKVKLLKRSAPNQYMNIENCTQLIVWRQPASPHGIILTGLPRMIFQELLRTHSIMIADEQQTEDGKRFWLDRMGESFVLPNHFVYYIDLNHLDRNKSPVIKKIADREELMNEFVQIGWGADEEHKNRTFVISQQDLV